ncbi:N-acetyltransferase [Nakamurella antarctica]|uniref:N-acetyltransferase n=2 Tax=Nakamurella antarctica TaxID=1902245 RepID=A0A3G8ZQQ8_9ACTN|nr:N-acetyltransferase [Nakamurella antarctica]
MDSWPHPQPLTNRLELVAVPRPVLTALVSGRAAAALPPPLVTPYLAGEECAGLWRMRSMQLSDKPGDAPWVTRFVVVPGVSGAVGAAGFHGAPDQVGMVEVGYRIAPEHRRNGYARQALEILLSVAGSSPDVRVVRASISPENHASRALIQQFAFAEVGEQWDDEDGLETLFEMVLRTQ